MRDQADMFYIILEGSVTVYKPFSGGEVQIVATLECGRSFGEIALIRNTGRALTARTNV